jgi:hypothetical protein
MILYSVHHKHEFGTGFYISRHIMDTLLDFAPVSEKICKIKAQLTYYNLTLISALAPTEEKLKQSKNNFISLWRRYVMQFPMMK